MLYPYTTSLLLLRFLLPVASALFVLASRSQVVRVGVCPGLLVNLFAVIDSDDGADTSLLGLLFFFLLFVWWREFGFVGLFATSGPA